MRDEPKRVWIVVNGGRGLREADTPKYRKIYAMFFSNKPTVYRFYADASAARRRQIRSYRRMMRPEKLRGMGRGFKETLRRWEQQTNVVCVEVL
jgi:hypothetical protein